MVEIPGNAYIGRDLLNLKLDLAVLFKMKCQSSRNMQINLPDTRISHDVECKNSPYSERPVERRNVTLSRPLPVELNPDSIIQHSSQSWKYHENGKRTDK
jgi:hypothetical protein